MKSILALDLSKTSTGFAYGFPNERPRSGSVRFGTPQHSEAEVGAKALVWLTTDLPVMAGYMPDIVAIEAAWEGNGDRSAHTSTVLLGLQFLMQSVAFLKTRKTPLMVNVASARKVLTGRGTYAKGEAKDAVQAECLRRQWLTPENMQADRADALAVWAFAAAQQMPELAFNRQRERV
jgi:Holliday junction resolvasome RuvABC endonuclease subunit